MIYNEANTCTHTHTHIPIRWLRRKKKTRTFSAVALRWDKE